MSYSDIHEDILVTFVFGSVELKVKYPSYVNSINIKYL